MSDTPAAAFFQQFKNEKDENLRHKILSDLIENAEPETEWLEFKGVGQVNDLLKGEWLKGEWSKYLSAFGNTGGGIIIWGIQSKKEKGRDVADKFNYVPDPLAFKGRIDSLRIPAVTPPVGGVENVSVIAPNEGGRGCVVSYIPKSVHHPHRADFSDKHYFIRVGDDCGIAPHELLRNLFFPRAAPVLKFELQVKLRTQYRSAGFEFSFIVTNIGNATARDIFVTYKYDLVGLQVIQHRANQDWMGRSAANSGGGYQCKHPLHPQVSSEISAIHANTSNVLSSGDHVERALFAETVVELSAFAENSPAQKLKCTIRAEEFALPPHSNSGTFVLKFVEAE